MRLVFYFLVIISVAILTGCGADSSDNSATGVYIDSNLKGEQSEPRLKIQAASDDSHIALNTKVSGDLDADNLASFTYQAEKSGYRLLYLSRDEEYSGKTRGDLELSIVNSQGSVVSRNKDNKEYVIFLAEPTEEYMITVKVEYFWSDYFLILVTPNRETLELNDDEYLVAIGGEVEWDCIEPFYNPFLVKTDPFRSGILLIVNWAKGYIRLKGVKENLAIVEKNRSVAYYEFSGRNTVLPSSVEYLTKGYMTMTVDPKIGDVEGDDDWTITSLPNYQPYNECDFQMNFTGGIVL